MMEMRISPNFHALRIGELEHPSDYPLQGARGA
jgi:hypothetical protein